MAKKTDKQLERNLPVRKDQVNEPAVRESLYEKLRDELFHYRVEIQSYKRSMSTLWACVSVVVALLGFFGYNRVEALLDRVEKSANERLSKTDSLLVKIDSHFLDSLMTVVDERTTAYHDAIAALEKGARVNNELYKKLISGLPYNKRDATSIKSYIRDDATSLFDIVYYPNPYSYNTIGDCYIVMGDEYTREKDDVFIVEVAPKNRNLLLFYQQFEVKSNYNKLHFKLEKYEQFTEYELVVILIRKRGKEYSGYRMTKPLTIN